MVAIADQTDKERRLQLAGRRWLCTISHTVVVAIKTFSRSSPAGVATAAAAVVLAAAAVCVSVEWHRQQSGAGLLLLLGLLLAVVAGRRRRRRREERPHALFVYGTLRRGYQWSAKYMSAGVAEYGGKATTAGALAGRFLLPHAAPD